MNPKMREVMSRLVPDYGRIRYEWSNMLEILLFEKYRWLVTGLKPNTIALDFGSGIGESAIYLARANNVNKVYAFEPNRKYCQTAKQYIRKAGLDGRIVLRNEKARLLDFHSRNVIIKSNCAGAEHKIFTGDADLSRVYKMQIAYRNGKGKLVETLKAKGFKVKVKEAERGISLGDNGMIFAERVRS